MGNTPIDRSPDSSAGADPPESSSGRDPSSTSAGTDTSLPSVVSAVGNRLRRVVSRLVARESARESTAASGHRDEAQVDAPATVPFRRTDGSAGLPSRRQSDDDHQVDRRAKALAVTDDLQSDPPEHPKTARLDVEQHGECLFLSRPGEPEAYISSTEWVSLEQ